MSFISQFFIFFFAIQLFKFASNSEQSEEQNDLCVSQEESRKYYQKLLNSKNLDQTLQNYQVIHPMRDGFSLLTLAGKYTIQQFEQFTEELKEILNAINEFEKATPKDTNLAKVLFCYTDSKNQVYVVLDGIFNHSLGQVSMNGYLQQSTKDNFFETTYKLFNTNYQMMKYGFANIDLGLQYAREKNHQLEYVFQPTLGLSKLPVNISDKSIQVKVAPEAWNEQIKNEKTLVYESLYVWAFFELQRQNQDQFSEELKLYARQSSNEQGVEQLRENLKRIFGEIYVKNQNQPQNQCDMNQLFDKVIIFNPELRIGFEEFLQCFKDAVTNSSEKQDMELI